MSRFDKSRHISTCDSPGHLQIIRFNLDHRNSDAAYSIIGQMEVIAPEIELLSPNLFHIY